MNFLSFVVTCPLYLPTTPSLLSTSAELCFLKLSNPSSRITLHKQIYFLSLPIPTEPRPPRLLPQPLATTATAAVAATFAAATDAATIISRWFRISKNRYVSTGPLTRPSTHSLAPFTHLLAQYCSLSSLAPQRLFICSLTLSHSSSWDNDLF